MGVIGLVLNAGKGAAKLSKTEKAISRTADAVESATQAENLAQGAENQSTLETVVDAVELAPVVGDVITVAKVGYSVGEGSYDAATAAANTSSSVQNFIYEAQGSNTRVIENQYTPTRVINDILNLNFTPETYDTKTGLRSRDNFSTIIERDENGSSIAAFKAYIDQNAQNGLTINTWIEGERDQDGTLIHSYSIPFSAAIGLEKYELAAYILKNDKTYINNQNPSVSNQTPMMILLEKPQSEKRDILINAMLDDKRLKIYHSPGNDVVDDNGWNIAMHAANNASFETMRRIIDEKGGNIKHINNNGENLIYRAVCSPDSAQKIQFLINNGVDPNKITSYSDTALNNALTNATNNTSIENKDDIDKTISILMEHADGKCIDHLYNSTTSLERFNEWIESHPEEKQKIAKNPDHPFHKRLFPNGVTEAELQNQANSTEEAETPSAEPTSPTVESSSETPEQPSVQPEDGQETTTQPVPDPQQTGKKPPEQPETTTPAVASEEHGADTQTTPVEDQHTTAPHVAPKPVKPVPEQSKPVEADENTETATSLTLSATDPSNPRSTPPPPSLSMDNPTSTLTALKPDIPVPNLGLQEPSSEPTTQSSTSPQLFRNVKIHSYESGAYSHADKRISNFKNKIISGVKLTDEKNKKALSNLTNMLMKKGYTKEEAQQNAKILYYKLLQSNLLYHPDENVKGSNKTISQLLGKNHRDVLKIITTDMTEAQMQELSPVIDNIENSISSDGHAIENVHTNRSNKAFNSAKKSGYRTQEATRVSDLRRTLTLNAEQPTDTASIHPSQKGPMSPDHSR